MVAAELAAEAMQMAAEVMQMAVTVMALLMATAAEDGIRQIIGARR